MPASRMNERQLIQLYTRTTKLTKYFNKIEPELFANWPVCIRIFRLLADMDLKEFASETKKSYNTISQYEIGGIHKIRRKEAERLAGLIKDLLPEEKSFEIVLKNFKKRQEIAGGGPVQAFKRAERAALTADERRVRNVLNRMGCTVQQHQTLNTNIGPLNFDFVGKGFVIECTTSHSKQKAESLAFRALKLKEAYPDSVTIAITPSTISNGVKRRLSDFDYLIFLNKLNALEAVLKKFGSH